MRAVQAWGIAAVFGALAFGWPAVGTAQGPEAPVVTAATQVTPNPTPVRGHSTPSSPGIPRPASSSSPVGTTFRGLPRGLRPRRRREAAGQAMW